MRFVYLPLVGILLVLFFRVFHALAKRDAMLTPILGWTVGLGFFLLVPLTIIAVNGGYESPNFYDVNGSRANVNLSTIESMPAFVMIWAALLLSLVSVLLFLPKLKSGWRRREFVLNDTSLKRTIYVTVFLAVVDYIVSIYIAGGLAQFLVSHWYLRAEDMVTTLGDRYVLYAWLMQANQTVFTAAAVLFTHSQARKGTVNWRFHFFLIVVLLFHVVFSGNRIFLALYVISLLVSCLLYGRSKVVVILLTAAPVLALTFSAWAYFRSAPTEIVANIPVYMNADLGNRTATVLMDAFDGSDTVLLFHIVNDFGEKYDLLYGSSYLRSLSFIVPRSIYPERARGFQLQLAEKYEPGETTSLAATQLGELYANFGPLSVLLLPLLTLMIMFGSEAGIGWIAEHAITSSVVFVLIIWTVRSTFEDNFITFLAALVIIRALRLERSVYSTPAGPTCEV
jgi:oligosaccharide repeat unit polymerase